MAEKFAMLCGLKFCRDERTGYYRNGTTRKLAHRHVWESERGPIPPGWQIHHIDRDRGNNEISNLLCLSAADHKALHIAEDETYQRRQQRAIWFKKNVTPAAVDWHGSEEGRAWHRQHAVVSLAKAREKVSRICITCNGSFVGVRRAKFCSGKCKSQSRRDAGADKVLRNCASCGFAFEANKFKAGKVCSTSCSNRHRATVKKGVVLMAQAA